jgi:DGQHR domain-containing protein
VDAQKAVALIEQEGWTEKRRLPGARVVLEKTKAHDEILENRLWCVLYHFGFEELNAGRNFQIQVTSEGQKVGKQIDVFAKDDEVIVVAECKSNQRKSARYLQKDIGEFGSLQKSMANSIRLHYGSPIKYNVIWLFVTSNIIWSEPDRSRARAQGIQIIEERELRYFEEISKNVGPAARYQFLGEFLNNQKIPALSDYFVPAIRAKLGGNWAYYFLAPASRIIPIAFVNHRGLRDLEGAPSYQRLLNRSRLRDVGAYLSNGGFFPNSILLNFRDDVRFDKQTVIEDRQIAFGQLYLPDRFKSAWVIDGQHRLFGFTELSVDVESEIVPILAFEKLSTSSEAELFATINSKQQKVAPRILDELAGELKLNSEDFNERIGAIASRALDMMASETGNPFEDRVKTADLADSDTICLTISAIKNAIVSSRLLGSMSRNGVEIAGPFSRRSTKETLNALCEGLSAYFALVEASNKERWEIGRPGYLCSNVGVQGFIRLLAALVEFLHRETGQEAQSLEAEELIEQIKPYLRPVLEFIEVAEDVEFVRKFKQPFGSGGPPRYFFELSVLVRGHFPQFKPAGFDELIMEQQSETADRGDALSKSIIDRVQGHVVRVLKQNFGSEYFERGIPQKEIKLSALDKKFSDKDQTLPAEVFLDAIDLKKIVEHKQNWEYFKSTLNIQLRDENKGQAKYLKWMETLNEVRRIRAHSFGRTYNDEDLEFLEFISEQLDARNV